MYRGHIKIWRKIKDWEWIDIPNVFYLFFRMTLMANWEDKKWHGILIKRGSFITSVALLVQQTKLSTQQVRTALNKLKSTNEITIKTTNIYTHISINNYDKYQDHNKQLNKRMTNEQQTDDKRITTTKEYKELKNNKNINTYVSSFNSYFGTKYQTTKGRIKKLSLRLEVYSMKQILQALKNLSASEFHMGKNDRGWKVDPDFLIRSDEQIDKWLNAEIKNKKPKKYIYLD